MTYLVERLGALRLQLEHLVELKPRVRQASDLEADLSLHNDVLFSLLMVAQLVIDIAGELSAREGLPFEDYTTAVRNLTRLEGFPTEMVDELARLPGFRNVLIHEYAELDYALAVSALDRMESVRDFMRAVAARLPSD